YRRAPLTISEILAEKTKFPKLKGNVLADIGDGAVGTHDNFVERVFIVGGGVIFFFGGAPGRLLFPGQDPAARHLAGSSELDGGGFFQLGERRIPEVQVENLALAGEEIVADIEAIHGAEVSGYDGVRDDLSDFGFFTAAFFNGAQGFAAEFRSLFLIFRQEL